jgi:quercetin dioxygenase-like cupin family protein
MEITGMNKIVLARNKSMQIKHFTIILNGILLSMLLFMSMKTATAEDATGAGLIRTPMLHQNVTLPSNQIKAKVIRVNFPPHFKTPWHTHDGPGPRYVVKGTLEVTEGDKVNTFNPGEVFWETGAKMMVENLSDNNAELIIFELAPGK